MGWAKVAIARAYQRERSKKVIKPIDEIMSEGQAERKRVVSRLGHAMSNPHLIEMFTKLNSEMADAGLTVTKAQVGYYGSLDIYPRQALAEMPQGITFPSKLWQDTDGTYWSHCRPILGYELKKGWGNKTSVEWIKGDYKHAWAVYEGAEELDNLIAFIGAYIPANRSPDQLRIEVGSPKDLFEEFELASLMQRHIVSASQLIKDALSNAITSYFRRQVLKG